jgi:hypothetical protein
MGLFGGRDKAPSGSALPTVRQLPARQVYCRVCNAERVFSRCWERISPLLACPACTQAFENPAALYQLNLPACPHCGEYLEQPGFEYGACDACSSKYEIVPGTKPSLLPNRRQRDEMNKYGKSWSRD